MFNLADYEDVATLNKWFISNFPSGRSDISVVSHDAEKGYILVQATLWRDSKDEQPAVSNLAFGSRDLYIQNMRKFYVEDTATSALGRAIILLKGSDKTATKDDMRKVDEFKPKYSQAGTQARAMEQALYIVDQKEKKNEPAPVEWSIGDVVADIGSNKPAAEECKHGQMILKEGTAKTGKPYYGYVCSAAKPDQCDAKWAKITANGKWFFEGGE